MDLQETWHISLSGRYFYAEILPSSYPIYLWSKSKVRNPCYMHANYAVSSTHFQSAIFLTISSTPFSCSSYIVLVVRLNSFPSLTGMFLLWLSPGSTVQNKIISMENNKYSFGLFSIKSSFNLPSFTLNCFHCQK